MNCVCKEVSTMAALCSIFSSASARLLVLAAALLAVCACDVLDSSVTWNRCKTLDNKDERVRTIPLDTNATVLDISFCKLTQIKRGDLDGLPNVAVIRASASEIARIDPAAFNSVPKLNDLYLLNNKLRELPVFDEHSFPHLTVLILTGNLIKGIYDPRTFSVCVKLLDLSLANNKIEYLHPDVFKPLSELTYLYISSNKLSFLPKTIFTSNTKLRWLELNNNNFAQLHADFVSELGPSVFAISLYNNPWQCSCLLELLADLKRRSVLPLKDDFALEVSHYRGNRAECVFSGAYPCARPTGLLKPISSTSHSSQ